jgi:hypothetical protein
VALAYLSRMKKNKSQRCKNEPQDAWEVYFQPLCTANTV